jgi:WD40 repeat protein
MEDIVEFTDAVMSGDSSAIDESTSTKRLPFLPSSPFMFGGPSRSSNAEDATPTNPMETFSPCVSYLATVHSPTTASGYIHGHRKGKGSDPADTEAECEMRIWCGQTYAAVCTLSGSHTDIADVCFSPDNSQLAVCSEIVWRISIFTVPAAPTATPPTLVPEVVLDVPGVSAIAFNNYGTQVVARIHTSVNPYNYATRKPVGKKTAALVLLDIESKCTIWNRPENFHVFAPVYFSVNGDLIISAAGDRGNDVLRFWNAVTGEEVRSISHAPYPIHDIAVSPLADVVATSSNGWSTRVWDIATGRQIRELMGQGQNAKIHISRDGTKLLSGCSNGHCLIYDAFTGQLLSIQAAPRQVLSLSFNVDDESKFTYAASKDVFVASADTDLSTTFREEKHKRLNLGAATRILYSNPTIILM